MQGGLDLETLRNSGIEGLMSAVSDSELWSQWEKVLAQAGMCQGGTHGGKKQFKGEPVQPVVVWSNPETSAEKAVTYFVPLF